MIKTIQVDKAYCLSLIEEEARRDALAPEFAKIGNEVEFFLSERSDNPQLSCGQNHQKIIQLAKNAGYESILIFEDDVRFYDFHPKQIDQINRFLQHNQDWELFYLGGLLGKIWRTKYRGIARIKCVCTQSYIINSRIYDEILEIDLSKGTKAIDTIFKDKFKNYSSYPLLTWQEEEAKAPSALQDYRNSVTGVQMPEGYQEEKWKKNRKKEFWQYNLTKLYKSILKD